MITNGREGEGKGKKKKKPVANPVPFYWGDLSFNSVNFQAEAMVGGQ